jgi:hypothetical protein
VIPSYSHHLLASLWIGEGEGSHHGAGWRKLSKLQRGGGRALNGVAPSRLELQRRARLLFRTSRQITLECGPETYSSVDASARAIRSGQTIIQIWNRRGGKRPRITRRIGSD